MIKATRLTLTVVSMWFLFDGNGHTQTSAGITSSSKGNQEKFQPLDLSSLSSKTTYAFAAGSNEPLRIQPVNASEAFLTPTHAIMGDLLEQQSFDAIAESAHLNQGQIQEPSAIAAANIFYSGMFSNASSQWNWLFNADLNNFLNELQRQRNAGLRIESMDIYSNTDYTGGLYAATWTRDNLGWAWALDYSNNDFVNHLNTYGQQGYRITDIERHPLTQQFGGVWIIDGKGWYWALNATQAQLSQLVQEQQNVGRRLIDLHVYTSADHFTLFAGVWVSNSDGYAWAWTINQPWESFQTLLNQHGAANRRLIDYEVYGTTQGVRYAGIWVGDGRAWAYSVNFSDQTSFANQIESWRNNNNLRPISFAMFTNPPPVVAVKTKPVQAIEEYTLAQNYPNPFNPSRR